MAMAMDARWFETCHGLNNLGRNILKLIAQHVTMEEICEHFGPCSSKNG
jgi:DNA-binding CsgD family transcriptional regulator